MPKSIVLKTLQFKQLKRGVPGFKALTLAEVKEHPENCSQVSVNGMELAANHVDQFNVMPRIIEDLTGLKVAPPTTWRDQLQYNIQRGIAQEITVEVPDPA